MALVKTNTVLYIVLLMTFLKMLHFQHNLTHTTTCQTKVSAALIGECYQAFTAMNYCSISYVCHLNMKKVIRIQFRISWKHQIITMLTILLRMFSSESHRNITSNSSSSQRFTLCEMKIANYSHSNRDTCIKIQRMIKMNENHYSITV